MSISGCGLESMDAKVIGKVAEMKKGWIGAAESLQGVADNYRSFYGRIFGDDIDADTVATVANIAVAISTRKLLESKLCGVEFEDDLADAILDETVGEVEDILAELANANEQEG